MGGDMTGMQRLRALLTIAGAEREAMREVMELSDGLHQSGLPDDGRLHGLTMVQSALSSALHGLLVELAADLDGEAVE